MISGDVCLLQEHFHTHLITETHTFNYFILFVIGNLVVFCNRLGSFPMKTFFLVENDRIMYLHLIYLIKLCFMVVRVKIALCKSDV